MSELVLLLQNSMNGGEITPKMDARSDQTRYKAGLRRGMNLVLYPHGLAGKRSGFRRIMSAGTNDERQRLVDFIFSTEQAYILEFGIRSGAGYMRVFKNNPKGQVVVPATDAEIVNGVFASSSGGWDDLSGTGASISLVNNRLDLVGDEGPAWAEQSVAHTSGGTLHVLQFDVTSGPVKVRVGSTSADDDILEETACLTGRHCVSFTPPEGNLTFYVQFVNDYGEVTRSVDNVSLLSGVPVEISTPFTNIDHLLAMKKAQTADIMYMVQKDLDAVYKLSRYSHSSWALEQEDFEPSIAPPDGVAVSAMGSTGSTTRRYAVTAVSDAEEESLPSEVVEVTNGNATLSDSNHDAITWAASEGASYYNVYEEVNSLLCFLGKSGNDCEFLNTGDKDANEDQNPPTARNPFEDERPQAVTFYEQRLALAVGQTVYTSQSADHANFNVSTPLQDNDACTYKIAADQVNFIRWLAPGKRLYFGTSGAEWTMTGENDGALTPSSVEVDRQTVRGCWDLQPLTVGDIMLFIQRDGHTIREFAYSLQDDGFKTSDISILSEHLLEGRTIVAWAYQQSPLSIIWCVLDDGTMRACTYNREHEVIGWTPIETDGFVESVACIPGPDDDEIWITTRRLVNGAWVRNVECLDPVFTGDFSDTGFFLDCGSSYDYPVDITAVAMADPVVVTAPGHGFSDGNTVRITEVRSRTEDADGFVTYAAHEDLNQKRYTVANATEDTFELSGVDGSAYAPYLSGGKVRKCVTTVTGLDYLEGRKVHILADGAVQPPQVVSGGRITLAAPKSLVHVGLPYVCEVIPVKPDVQGRPVGTIQGLTKRIIKAWVRVYKTVGLKHGPDRDHLTEVQVRSDLLPGGTALPLVTSDIFMEFDGDYDVDSMFLLRHDTPLPFFLAAIIMQLEVGEP